MEKPDPKRILTLYRAASDAERAGKKLCLSFLAIAYTLAGALRRLALQGAEVAEGLR
ncbi:hypothetical protein [Candidatus Methylacidithermus pantelleriae]|uniref:Uncharacterized protein n=1 Tax=Candidatus Methylacidithermus pantelleriae TaxID=2744239 RepID=A0A8J2BTW6_9BACT|nr:hypothetical protein [Candidatus Methylacidithermus pantelleriae]CAF0700230.1 hypothetical protein MPNT_340011 [Candidatus Methylacidithermus pantelleriae]